MTDGTHHSPTNGAEGQYKYVTAKNIRPWGLDLAHITYVTKEIHDQIYARCAPEHGDVLYIKDGVTTGLAAVNTLKEPFSMLSSVALLKPRRAALEPVFLKHWLNCPDTFSALTANMSGSAIRRLVLRQLRKAEVPLPPLNEQRRIVAKLDACMTHTKKAKEALDAIPPLLEKFRQSVLAAAFRGDLTKDWREKNPDVEPILTTVSRIDVKPPRTGRRATIEVRAGRSALSVGNPGTEAPEGWCWIQLTKVARLESGHTPSRKFPEYWGGPIQWVGIKDARDSHGAVLAETYQRITQLGLENSAARLLPAKTVCLVRTAASIGYVTILGQAMATSQDLVNWVCSDAIVPEYLMHLLVAEKQSILSFGRGSAHKTVYYPEIKAFHVCLPPVEEQHEVVAILEERLKALAEIGRAYDRANQVGETLNASLLAKAFRGELVPQDPNDEPASVLLERIRAERAAAEAAKPKKKRKARKKKA